MDDELFLVTKTVPAACRCCKDEVTLEAGDIVEIVATDRDGTVEVHNLRTNDYVNCHAEVLLPWPLPKGE